MKFKQKMLMALVGTALTAAFSGASAQTVRIANQGDSLSLDPHSLNESLQLSTTGNAYEPLVDLDKKLNVVPGLAHKLEADVAHAVALRFAQERQVL